MGLLDPKTRVLDTLLTNEGRRQLSQGLFRIDYVAFSDASVFYTPDALSGSTDPTSRICLEATSLPQDLISFRADDSGKLSPFRSLVGSDVIAGRLTSGSVVVPVSDAQFASMSDKFFASSADNFRKLMVIGSIDQLFGDERFELNKDLVELTVTDRTSQKNASVRLSAAPELHDDARFSNLDNFAFLPPIVKTQTQTVKLGDFQFRSSEKTASQINDAAVSAASSLGNVIELTMDPTSQQNRTALQVFETQPDGSLVKLDITVIDRLDGTFDYLAGKVVKDDDEYKFFSIFVIRYV